VSSNPLRVGCIGIGWWSDVLADAIQRSGKLEILSCYTRSEEKRKSFAAKYRCRPLAVNSAKNDTLVEELEEFAAAARGQGQHEVGGEDATISLAVVRAGVLSAREGRRVEVAEILDSDRNL
jgi:predicted dehydrogenase